MKKIVNTTPHSVRMTDLETGEVYEVPSCGTLINAKPIEEPAGKHTSGAELARVKPEDLASREKYAYYSLETASVPWTEDVSEASVVLEGMPDEFSVSYNARLKSYLAVYYDAEGGRVLARLARYPWGPWGEPAALLACAKAEYCYGAKEQPGFAAEGGGKIFFTLEKKNAPYLYELAFEGEDHGGL